MIVATVVCNININININIIIINIIITYIYTGVFISFDSSEPSALCRKFVYVFENPKTPNSPK